ncbi:MAG: TerB family tellurite resistance protein [Gemmatimonadetes bacterium]|nr:TerB family tellurite resistance protein [Gemmatimonadota bacterium]MDA1104162.1 TerB family tellurite resistance protein [Gemmatimonadota bacterium]
MISAIKRFFSSSMSPAPEADVSVAKKDIRLAACALLLELANADDEFTDDERQHLESAVRRQFGLGAADAERLLELAQEARSEAVDLWQFTNLIAENYSTGQKMVLAEIMWGLVYSDGDLASKEDYLMRKICNLLRLEPGYLAEARQRFTETDQEDPMQAMD